MHRPRLFLTSLRAISAAGLWAACAASAPLRAADAPTDPLLEEATSLPAAILFDHSGAPGMVLVVVHNGKQIVLGLGETAKGNHEEPTGQSLFRLNSLSKVLTGQVLAALVNERKVAFSTPLATLAPMGFANPSLPRFPAAPARAITLLDLATYAAALPREIGEAPPGTIQRTWPTLKDRWTWLTSQHNLPWEPGTVTAYSNVAFDFLADALADADQQPYPATLQRTVTGPLHMPDTTSLPTAAQCARLMLGSGLGGPDKCVNTTATAGSGGLYSTGDDMARWLLALTTSTDPATITDQATYRLRQSMPAALGFDEAGPMAGLGLG